MATIKAPFNFVPLDNKVFYPSWGDEISHDIPFEDSQSGLIELELEAMTPVYVRNGHNASESEGADAYLKFSNFNNQYFLPATSVKGMVRNVLEIMSFSKIPVDARKKYAQRDWENRDGLYTLKNVDVQKNIHCGWLRMQDDKFIIEDCGLPYRINQREIDKYLFSKQCTPFLETHFCKNNKEFDLNKEQSVPGSKNKIDPKMALFKYKMLGDNNLHLLEDVACEEDAEHANKYQPRRIRVGGKEDITGTIVFTGQPDKWVKERKNVKGAGKYYEFLFPDNVEKRYSIEEIAVEHFKFIYQDSADWVYWRNKFENEQPVPVFFRIQNGKVIDFGLSLLYKLPYDNSVKDVVEKYQKIEYKRYDLAECIFGSAEKGNSLKGRVQMGNAFATEGVRELPLAKTVLGSPKASYYPLYISQYGSNGIVSKYATYNDGVISGWKRYPVKDTAKPCPTNMDKLDSSFIPLGKGVKFKSLVRYHNLRKEELGALLSAISFHGNQEHVFHNIGMAKPYGYGKMKVSCRLLGDVAGMERELMALFENTMDYAIGSGVASAWVSCQQIKELLTMGYGNHKVATDQLEYMKLTMKGDNDFVTAKNKKELFLPFSQLAKGGISAPSLYAEYKEKFEQEIRLKQAEQEALLQAERAAAELAARQAQEAIERQEAEARATKLSQLSQQGPIEIKEEKDFDKGKGKLDTYVKKVGLDSEFHPMVKAFVGRCYQHAPNRDKKRWESPFDQNHIFRKIVVWVGEDIAKQWYAEIIKNQ